MNERRNNGDGRRQSDVSKQEMVAAAGFLKRWGTQLLIGYLILLTVAIGGMFVLQRQTSDLTNQVDLANFKICHRLNLLRAGDNVSHFVEWTILSHITHEPRLERLSMRLTWIPLTPSCRYAVDHATSFQAPNQVYFYKRVPTLSDLYVGPGE